MTKCTFRLRYKEEGIHVHCAVFVKRKSMSTFAKCGQMTVRTDEWPTLKEAFSGAEILKE